MIRQIVRRLCEALGLLARVCVLFAALWVIALLLAGEGAPLEEVIREWVERFRASVRWEPLIADYRSSLALYAIVMTGIAGFGIPLGILIGGSGLRWVRAGAGMGLLAAIALPAFGLGLVALYVVVHFLELPVLGDLPGDAESGVADDQFLNAERVWSVFLPACILSIGGIARVAGDVGSAVSRKMHVSAMMPLISRGVGVSRRLYRYALPAARGEMVGALKTVLPPVIGASLILEWILFYPGIGARSFEALRDGNYETVAAAALLLAVSVIAWRFLLDVAEVFISRGGKR